MKIIADEDIPLVPHYFGHCGDIIFKSGRTLSRHDLLDADILLTRSVTPINQSLLQGTSVRFVGSTVTGLDHIDTQWLDQQGIRWACASGCNADAVAEYVVCVIAALGMSQNKLRAGVIGVGNVGSRVVEKLKALGFEVVQCDPIRAANEKNFRSLSLDDFSDLDLVTLHTPLTREGIYPTFHMIEKNFLQRQKSGAVLLNTSRGAVIDSDDLKKYGGHLKWCFDVWENEPNIDTDILLNTSIATQHIAGHSIQAKYRGIEMVFQKACELGIVSKGNVTPANYPTKVISFQGRKLNWREVVLGIFNPLTYSEYIKTELLSSKKIFDQLRKEFIDHHEFGFVEIKDVVLSSEDAYLLGRLGILWY